jgi:hypothetical protein
MKEKETLVNTKTWLSIIAIWDQSLLELWDDFLTNISEINVFRGKVISLAISIEHRLNGAIEYLLFEESNKISESFQQIFLQGKHISFIDKYQIFLKLCKQRHWEKSNYIKSTTTPIQKTAEIRNFIAHAWFYYHIDKKIFYFRNYDNWIETQEIIDSDYMSKTTTELYEYINNLSNLIKSDQFNTTKLLTPIKKTSLI